MGHFRGTLQGCRGEASRLGSKGSGLQVEANGWGCGVDVSLYYDKDKDTDFVVVALTGGSNKGLGSKEIFRGTEAELRKKLGEKEG